MALRKVKKVTNQNHKELEADLKVIKDLEDSTHSVTLSNNTNQ